MANLRTLKKNIAFVAEELITTICFKSAQDGDIADKASELIVKTISVRNEFIARANHIDKKNDKKAVKAYFKTLYTDLRAEVEALAKAINEI